MVFLAFPRYYYIIKLPRNGPNIVPPWDFPKTRKFPTSSLFTPHFSLKMPINSQLFLMKRHLSTTIFYHLLCVIRADIILPYDGKNTAINVVGRLGRSATCGSSQPSNHKSEAPKGSRFYWHILCNLIQCNAVERSVAFVKRLNKNITQDIMNSYR